MTTDMSGAESFYKTVVGWNPAPFAPDGSYVVFNKPGGDGGAGGMMLLPDAARQMGATPHWLMYVGTPDVDATAMRIAQLGGRVVKQPADIPGTGRFAVVSDPTGAMFGIYQPDASMAGQSRGPQSLGDFSWFELYTPNPDAAWNFYSAMFGWEKTSAMDMGEMGVYQMVGRGGGIPNGGMMQPPPGAPAAWMPYALVKDAKGAAELITANGGQIVNGPMEVPGGDWIVQGIDPQGVMFSLHSLNPAAAQAAAPEPERASAPGTQRKPAKKAAPAKKKATPKKKAAPAKKAAPKKKAVTKSASNRYAPKGWDMEVRKRPKAKAKPVKKSAKPAKKKAASKPAKTVKRSVAKKKAPKKPTKK